MNSEIEKYLKTEREISLFKIESLKKLSGQLSPSTKRLIEIEEEFLSIRFEDMATTTSELFAAIKIFRDSRRAFHDLYSPPPKKQNWVEEDIFIQFVIKKITDATLSKIKKESHAGIKEERASARFLAIALCLILYLEKIDSDLSRLKILGLRKDICKDMISKYQQDIFIFFNDVISYKQKFSFLDKDHQNLLMSVKPLLDITAVSNFNCDESFFSIRPVKIKGNQTFGFFLPYKHIGRETMRPYHIKLYDSNNVNVSKLFSLTPKSIIPTFSSDYYKFIQMLRPEDISDNLILLDKYYYLIKEIFGSKLNKAPGFSLSCSQSSILIPVSRTEDEGLRESLLMVHEMLSNILTNIF